MKRQGLRVNGETRERVYIDIERTGDFTVTITGDDGIKTYIYYPLADETEDMLRCQAEAASLEERESNGNYHP